jgi:Na+/proline symporter
MGLNNLNIIDYAIVAVYFISMILIGFLVIRLNKKEQDYFKGGNRIPWIMSAMSLFIGSFTAYMFVGASGQAHIYIRDLHNHHGNVPGPLWQRRCL